MASAAASDVELRTAWQGGANFVFETSVQRHVVATVRNGVEANEALHQGFFVAGRGASGFGEHVQPWLHPISLDTGRGRLRRGAKRREVSTEQAFCPADESGRRGRRHLLLLCGLLDHALREDLGARLAGRARCTAVGSDDGATLEGIKAAAPAALSSLRSDDVQGSVPRALRTLPR